ncbi:MAG: SDR family oxidoreductase [Cyanobacteria bacterium REEB67]|nr:SDR family oxidoreductase [Cyanobacteria bacterium REEB67]
MNEKVSLVVGASGISGLNLATHLAAQNDGKVYGLSRNPIAVEGVKPIAADLLDISALKQLLKDLGVTHAYFTTWLRQENEEKNCEVNGQMLTNLLDALQGPTLNHVTLVTGGKNYFGSFEDSGNFEVVTPYREDQLRKPGLNFYYTQEDILWDRAARDGFTWNVHRPQTIIGYALGNSMNMGVTLAVYATICKETNRPFIFPGSPVQYNGVADITDARILAKQIHWAATTPAAHNQAFNIDNGDIFRWSWMWQQIADYFRLVAAPYPGHATPLEIQMKDAGPAWNKIVQEYGLQKRDVHALAPWWHTDSDLSRPFESFDDMSKSRALGFLEYKKSSTSFTDLFDKLRAEKIIPSQE